MAKMKKLDWAATILVIVGAVNWGLVGLNGTNLVTMLAAGFENQIYMLVGAAGLYSAFRLMKK